MEESIRLFATWNRVVRRCASTCADMTSQYQMNRCSFATATVCSTSGEVCITPCSCGREKSRSAGKYVMNSCLSLSPSRSSCIPASCSVSKCTRKRFSRIERASFIPPASYALLAFMSSVVVLRGFVRSADIATAIRSPLQWDSASHPEVRGSEAFSPPIFMTCTVLSCNKVFIDIRLEIIGCVEKFSREDSSSCRSSDRIVRQSWETIDWALFLESSDSDAHAIAIITV